MFEKHKCSLTIMNVLLKLGKQMICLVPIKQMFDRVLNTTLNSRPAFACSKSTMETPEQCMKYVQS